MIAGECYLVQLYVHPSNYPADLYESYATDDIEIYFSAERITDSVSIFNLPVIPQFENTEGNFLYTEDDEWVLVNGFYTAMGGENWITVGNFNNESNTDILDFMDEVDGAAICYYFIDDVSVTKFSDGADLISDITSCVGETVTVSAPPGALSYLWNTKPPLFITRMGL